MALEDSADGGWSCGTDRQVPRPLEDKVDTDPSNVQFAQRAEALARANRARIARADVKRRIAEGAVNAAEVILFHPGEIDRMPVADVLTSQRGWGIVRCRRLLLATGIAESKPIGSMTERQRRVLAARLSITPPQRSSPHLPGAA